MRVLHVIAGLDPKEGGVCQAVRTIVAGLGALGVHNEVVSLDAPEAPFLAHDTFTTHGLGPAKGPWAYSTRLVPWLLENFGRFDAVVVHGLWLYHGHAVGKALRHYKARRAATDPAAPRLYIMPHGMLDPYFQRAPGRKLKAIRNYFYWKLIEGRVVNEAEGLLFTCEQECRLAREPFRPYRPKREAVVGLGVEAPPSYEPAMQEAFRKQCPEIGEEPYILFLSRIHEKKGVDLLLQAYAALVRSGTGAGHTTQLPRLVVAGPGLDSAYGRSIRQLVAADERLRGRVSFPGMLSGASKWGAFYGSEAFVLPSHQENFGIAVVEALACGTPALISNQVNIWREIEGAGAGFVAADTLAGTRQLLETWLATSAAEQTTMRARAQTAFITHFATRPAAERLLQALQQ